MKGLLRAGLAAVVALGLGIAVPTHAEDIATLTAAEVTLDDGPLPTSLELRGRGDGALILLEAMGGVDLDGLEPGAHQVSIRFQDDAGNWSAPLVQGFALVDRDGGSDGVNRRLGQAEAFFDTDPGPGNGIPLDLDGGLDGGVGGDPDLGLDLGLDLGGGLAGLTGRLDFSSLAPGPHTLYVRVANAAGFWSVPLPQGFVVPDGGSSGGAAAGSAFGISAAEAFFDTDPGEGDGHPLDLDGNVAFSTALQQAIGLLDVSDLQPGLHTLYLRVRNAAGFWSVPLSASVVRPEGMRTGPGTTDGPAPIVAADYAVDSGAYLAAPAADGAFGGLVELIDLAHPVDTEVGHGLAIRFHDSAGRISSGAPPAYPIPNDSDWDDLPDPWERQWFGSLDWGADDDPDGDGLSNLREHQDGTDPLVPAGDALTISGIVRAADGARLTGAEICILGPEGLDDCSTLTDGFGHYIIGQAFALAPGEHRVSPRATAATGQIGFAPVEQTLALADTAIAGLDFQAEPLAVELTAPADAGPYRIGYALTLEWSGSGRPDLPVTLSMKRLSVPPEQTAPLPDDPDWAVLAVGTANDGTETLVLPAGMTLADDWFFIVEYQGLDIGDESDTPWTLWPENISPIADAGADQVVVEGAAVTLDGSASYDPDVAVAGWSWTQVSGPPVELAGADTPWPVFTAPQVDSNGALLTFELVVTDEDLEPLTGTDWVQIQVRNSAPVVTIDDPWPDAARAGEIIALHGSAGPADQAIAGWHWSAARLSAGVAETDRLHLGGPDQLLTDALPAGDWRVYLQAVNTDGRWSAPVSRDLQVLDGAGLSDLALVQGSIRILDRDGAPRFNPVIGETVLIEATLLNAGEIPVPDEVRLDLFLGAPAEGIALGSATLAHLGEGERVNVRIPWRVGETAAGDAIPAFGDGLHPIWLRADFSANLGGTLVVDEANRQNNAALIALPVGAVDTDAGIVLALGLPELAVAGQALRVFGSVTDAEAGDLPLPGAQVAVAMAGQRVTTWTLAPDGRFAAPPLRLPDTPGEYPLSVSVFGNNRVTTETITLTVVAADDWFDADTAPLLPQTTADLRIDEILLDGVGLYRDDRRAAMGGTLGVAALIENAGQEPVTASFDVSFYAGDPEQGGQLLGSATVNGLAADERALVESPVDWALAAQGLSAVYVQIDPQGLVAEVDPVANRARRAVDVRVALPDPRPIVAYATGIAAAGETLTGHAQVLNQGPADLDAPLDVALLLSVDGTLASAVEVARTTLPAGLGAGVAADVDAVLDTTSLDAGSYVLFALLDPDGLIAEDDETNNTVADGGDGQAIVLTNAEAADSGWTYCAPGGDSALPVELLLSRRVLAPVETLTLTAILENRDGLGAGPVDVDLYQGDPAAGGVLLQSVQSGSLPACGRASVVLSWTAPSEAGSYWLYAAVDGQQMAVPVRVAAGAVPDSGLAADAILLDPVTPLDGDRVQVSAEIRNRGPVSADGLLLGVRLDDGAGAVLHGPRLQVDGLAAGATRRVVAGAPIDAVDGVAYDLTLELTPSPLAGDPDPADSRVTGSFDVGTPPRSVTVLAPNGGDQWQAGDLLVVQWQSTAIAAGTPMRIDLRRDAATALSAPDGVNWFRLTAAARNRDGVSSHRVLVPSGLAQAGDWFVEVAPAAQPHLFDRSDTASSYGPSTAPDAVVPVIDGAGSGTEISLDWSGYDEVGQIDLVAGYEVYAEPTAYARITDLTPAATLPAGTDAYRLTGLTRGQTYHLAVVARDVQGNALVDVTPISAAPSDVQPPEEVGGLGAESGDTSVLVSWDAPADIAGDLVGYLLYLDDAAEGIAIDAGTLSYVWTGLAPASAHAVRITTLDGDGNESPGVGISAYTLLPNPAVVAAPSHQAVTLSWPPVQPSALLQGYRVYWEASPFSVLDGLTPKRALGSTATEARFDGLTNGATYWFAVTAVNLAGAEQRSVTPVAAAPVLDTVPPEVGDLRFAGQPLSDGAVLTASGPVSLTASDPYGMSRVELELDGVGQGSDSNGVDGWSLPLDITAASDGPHTLTLRAFDSLGNEATVQLAVTIALATPPAPTLTAPADGTSTGQARITVTGSALPGTRVSIYRDAEPIAGPVDLDRDGRFSVAVVLNEGANAIQAAAGNRAGIGALSAAVQVTLDTNIPSAPTNLYAQARADGVVRLTWAAVPGAGLGGYEVYRSTGPFESPWTAVKLTQTPLTGTVYNDLPATDGTYYYRVLARSAVGNASPLSNQVSAIADATAPVALAITYDPQGAYDAAGGRFGVGQVAVTLSVSEPLLAAPFLTLTPDAGMPITVALTPIGETDYQGQFEITALTPSGTAYAVFSARDAVGNRGTEILAGESILIDTDGPEVIGLDVTPAEPVRNDPEPAAMTVVLTLDEAPADGTEPALGYLRAGAGGDEQPVTLTRTDALVWSGTFTLPADAAAAGPETVEFSFSAVDDLGNHNDRIAGGHRFQVYQGELPPLDVPTGLAAEALPGGEVRLEWDAVEGAADYQLYRAAPGEAQLSAYLRSNGALELNDATPFDGTYRYALASVRMANGQEGISGYGPVVEVEADATPPEPPTGLTLELIGAGIRAAWTAPDGEPSLTYRLYRAEDEILSLDGLTPVVADIADAGVTDTAPSEHDHHYAVSAVDAAGNESLPSVGAYLNFDLLPVSDLQLTLEEGGLPELSWVHNGSTIIGYNLYLIQGAAELKLTSVPLSEPGYIDSGYTGGERRYAVAAVDGNGVEGPRREVWLPPVDAEPSAIELKRGVINRIDYQLHNPGDALVSGIRVRTAVGGHESTTPMVVLEPGETLTIAAIVGGHADLPELAELITTLEISAASGELVRLIQRQAVEIGDGVLSADIQAETITRGGTGQVSFGVGNNSPVEIEILTATSTGDAPSDEARVQLLDTDGNVLVSLPVEQVLGDALVHLPNGDTVARIAPGARFESAPITFDVPAATPDHAVVRLVVDEIHYHRGREDQVSIQGFSVQRPVTLTDVSYSGDITGISPQASRGDEPILISGRALAAGTTDPLPRVPLDLVITVNGFERSFPVVTGGDGSFSYTFEPLPGESGTYQVAAVHPDLDVRPVQGQFSIGRVIVSPAGFDLRMPRDHDQNLTISAKVGAGITATNLRLVYRAEDQPLGELPVGLVLGLPEPRTFNAGQTASLPLVARADATAEAVGAFVIAVVSDESGDEPLARVRVDYRLSLAEPALVASPGFIETGAAPDDSVSESLVLKNQGLAALEGLTLALRLPDNEPAPGWVFLSSAAEQGDLAIGETRSVTVTAAPTAEVGEGVYELRLHARGTNAPAIEMPVYISVTRSGTGGALFHVSDIYTATLDAGGSPIPGLAGAGITLWNEAVATEQYSLTTDSAGEALFENLPAGRYKFRARAANHHDQTGRLWIKPGVVETRELFLDKDLVSVEWSVTEITLEDRYELNLNATYETDVPAAVVVMEPASVNLPEMQPGDVHYGEFTLTNHGLIRAYDLGFALSEIPGYKVELLGGLPDSLAAKERVTIPYRVTALGTTGGADSGGADNDGCQLQVLSVIVTYRYECSNGDVRQGSGTLHLLTSDGCNWIAVAQAIGAVVAPVIESTARLVKRIFGPHEPPRENPDYQCVHCGDELEPAPDSVHCWPVSERYEVVSENSLGAFIWFQVGCSANTVLREFQDEANDLSVKVPGGVIQVQRRFYGDAWHWDHARTTLLFDRDPLTDKVKWIARGGVIYDPLVPGNDALFVNEQFEIVPDDDGWLWRAKSGDWERYDQAGRPIAYGNRAGTIGKLLYASADAAQPTGIADRNDRQVIWLEYQSSGLLGAVEDGAGRRVEYVWTDGLLTGVTDAVDGEHVYAYNADGQMTRKTDPAGRPTLIAYNQFGDIESVTGADGTGTWFEFDYDERTKERYAQLRTSSGKITEVWYNEAGEVRRVDINGRTYRTVSEDVRAETTTDEKGNVTLREFDEWDNLTGVVYADGSTVSFEYDYRFNLVKRAVDLRGYVNQYSYDQQGSLLTKVEALGTNDERTTHFTYDDANQLLEITLAGDADTETATTHFTYDDSGNIASITDPEGHSTELLAYDAMGNLLRMRDPRGHEWRFAYDELGRLVSKTDPEDNETSYEYDGANNPTAVIDAEAKRFGFAFNDDNQIVSATDPLGYEQTIDYNSDGLPVLLTDQQGKTVEQRYDNEERLLSSLVGPVASGYQTSYQYDETNATFAASSLPVQVDHPTYVTRHYYDRMQRLVRSVDVLDAETEYASSIEYDIAGNPIAITDAEGRTTRKSYDALNRVSAVQDAAGEVTTYRYDDRGNVVAITDPNDGITRLDYDRNGKLTALIRPLGQTTHYEYDATGNRTAIVDAKGQRIEYDYSPANRLVQERHFAADDLTLAVNTIDYSYDKLGRLTGYSDGTTSAEYAYDALGQKTGVTVDYGAFSLEYGYTYYPNGLKETFTGPDGITYRYFYDDANRLSAIELPDGSRVTYSGYRWNRPEQVTLPGGITLDYGYDPLQRLTDVDSVAPGGDAILSDRYMRTPLGKISGKATEQGSYAYAYDDLDRLIEALHPVLTSESYTYDPLGNRLSAEGIDGLWDYDPNNRLLGYGEQTLDYDANGNLIRQASPARDRRFSYDIKDRMVRVTLDDGSVVAEYYYNPFGRRLWKDVNGLRTYYAYADEGLIGEYDANGTKLRSYGYRPDSLWTTDPLFQKVGNSFYWYQNDHLGTPQRLVDSSGSLVWSAVYSAFGQAQVGVATVENNLRLAGQYYDAETGWHYNWHRYYHPSTGRYLSVDPLGEGLNSYLYALGSPLLIIDPEGTHGLRVVGGVLQVVGGAALTVGSGGLGAAGGILLIANGLDNLVAGGSSLLTQENHQALLEQAVYQLVPEKYAPWVYVATQIAIPYGATKLAQMGRAQVAADALSAQNGLAGDVRYGPMNQGPLPKTVANTFRSGSYTQHTTAGQETFYRVYGGKAGELGSYWSRTSPAGPLQSQIDLALNPQWGNTATQAVRINVPKGVTVFEGAAASQGGLVGGGSQVFIPTVNPSWVVP